MSPRLSALEEKMEVQDAMDLLEMGEEAKTTEFVIGTEPELRVKREVSRAKCLRLRNKERRRKLQRRA